MFDPSWSTETHGWIQTQVWEEDQDEADSAEEVLSENVAAEAEQAKALRRRRMAAVGPYVMPW